MTTHPESKTIEQLLDEADELIQRMNSDAIQDMEEERRIQAEKHAQYLKKIKSEVLEKIKEKDHSEKFSGAEGMHEAIREIVKASDALKKYLFHK